MERPEGFGTLGLFVSSVWSMRLARIVAFGSARMSHHISDYSIPFVHPEVSYIRTPLSSNPNSPLTRSRNSSQVTDRYRRGPSSFTGKKSAPSCG